MWINIYKIIIIIIPNRAESSSCVISFVLIPPSSPLLACKIMVCATLHSYPFEIVRLLACKIIWPTLPILRVRLRSLCAAVFVHPSTTYAAMDGGKRRSRIQDPFNPAADIDAVRFSVFSADHIFSLLFYWLSTPLSLAHYFSCYIILFHIQYNTNLHAPPFHYKRRKVELRTGVIGRITIMHYAHNLSL